MAEPRKKKRVRNQVPKPSNEAGTNEDSGVSPSGPAEGAESTAEESILPDSTLVETSAPSRRDDQETMVGQENGRGVAHLLKDQQFMDQVITEMITNRTMESLIRHSPDRTTFPGYSSRRDAANYNLAFQGRQMRPDSLKFLLSWTNHRPAKRKISKPLVYDQVSSLGSPFALYDPVTVINPDAPKVD